MRSLCHFISIFAILALLGCSTGQATFGVEAEKKRWAAEGWTYLETFGRPAEDTVMVGHMNSATAREITAFARTDGVATNQVYAQKENLYLVVSMQRPSGDAFALVFTKPKP